MKREDSRCTWLPGAHPSLAHNPGVGLQVSTTQLGHTTIVRLHLPYASEAESHRSLGPDPSCQHLLGLITPQDKLLG